MIMFFRKKSKSEKKKTFNYKILPAIIAVWLSVFLFVCNLLIPPGLLGKPEAKKFPEISQMSLADGTFFRSAEDYFNNNFFLKNAFCYLKNNLRVALGNYEVGDVLITPNRLLKKTIWTDPDEEMDLQNTGGSLAIAQHNLDAAKQLIQKIDVPVFLGLVPTACDIYKSELSNVPDLLDEASLINRIYDVIPSHSGVDIYTALNAQKGESIYYYTDTRWTSYGAYIGYGAVMKSMGGMPIPLEYFNIEHAAHEYYGNLYQETYIKPSNKDVVDLYHYAKGEPAVEVTRYSDGKAEKSPSVFRREYLKGDKAQNVFLGEPCGITKVHTDLENGESLLIFKDSFADPMIQFFMLHYENITLVDLAQLTAEESKQLDINSYSSVLLLYNVAEFIENYQIGERLNWFLNSEQEGN